MQCMDNSALLLLADNYAAHQRISHWAVSFRAMKKGDFFARLRAGKGCTVKTHGRVMQWFSDHWPLDLAWPADIPRPAAREGAAAAGRRVRRKAA